MGGRSGFLMDTHTFLWFLMDGSQLSDAVLEIVRNVNNAVYVSMISMWELSLKYSMGKLKLEGTDPGTMLAAALREGILELSLTHEDCASYHLLATKEDHKDPFDRMLIWQAISHEMPILSKDSSFQQYRQNGLELIW
jgi:PIN domain nuclease of toxin-antitoxin system